MLRKFIRLDADNVVCEVRTSRIPPDDPIWHEVDPTIPHRDLHRMMHVALPDGDTELNLVERPQSPDLTQTGTDFTVLDCPNGTVIEILDMSGEEVMARITVDQDGFAQQFALPDPGTYEVTIEAPAPHIPTIRKVVIQ